MAYRMTILGNHMSPFVRKVLAVCAAKGLEYEIDSFVPFFGDEKFSLLSPLRRIPVLIDGSTIVNDSSVIAEYLEDKWPGRPVLPRDPEARARSRYLDEYADTRLATVILWKVFGRALVAPAIFGAARDLAAVQKTVAEEVPLVMDELEKLAPETGFAMGDAPGLADFSIASHFANFRWARQTLDAARWPRATAWIARVEASAPMQPLIAIGERMLRVPPNEHRAALEALGVRVAAETVAGAKTPVKGPMTVI